MDGILKHLTSHVYESSGNTLFELREQCIVVRVISTGMYIHIVLVDA